MHFLDSMGPFTSDRTMCLKEFSKSLIDKAYTWYVNLKPGSVGDWEHLVSMFNTKFFMLRKFSLTELGPMSQRLRENWTHM